LSDFLLAFKPLPITTVLTTDLTNSQFPNATVLTTSFLNSRTATLNRTASLGKIESPTYTANMRFFASLVALLFAIVAVAAPAKNEHALDLGNSTSTRSSGTPGAVYICSGDNFGGDCRWFGTDITGNENCMRVDMVRKSNIPTVTFSGSVLSPVEILWP
jgi:hypothetical protein